ncbi:hypothetical protein NBRC116602_17380 [Hyphomicrobiales bacterium 4NK60-0047b]
MTETTTNKLTSETLSSWGHKPGKEFGAALRDGTTALIEGKSLVEVRAMLESYKPAPTIPLRDKGELEFSINIEASSPDEEENIIKVSETMTELMRTPTVEAGTVMPDACPAGPLGTIPVGGVVATKNAIHPGMHSADICCSVMMTNFGEAEPKSVLDAVNEVTHFGRAR